MHQSADIKLSKPVFEIFMLSLYMSTSSVKASI